QESMTDPSFAGQLIAFTYPHIGNYGTSAQAMESERAWARAAIMREACNREDAPTAERGWLDWLADRGVQGISGVDTRALVMHIRDAGAMRGGVFPAEMPEDEARELIDAEPLMVGLDLASVARVSLHPCASRAKDLLAEDPDAVFLSNGPGDPAALSYIVDTVREIV